MEGARAPAPPKDGTKSLPKPVEPARVRSSGGWSGTPARKVEGGSVEVDSAEGGSSEGGSAEGGSGGGANVSMAAPIPMAFSAASCSRLCRGALCAIFGHPNLLTLPILNHGQDTRANRTRHNLLTVPGKRLK